MKRIIVILTLSLIFILCFSFQSPSFNVRPAAYAQHHNIVYWALDRIGGFGVIPCYGLDIKVMLANQAETPDLNGVLEGWDWLHFRDHSWWGVARDYMRSYREAAAFSAYFWSEGINPQDIEDATWCLGLNFHCVADFYAHSNWVEKPELYNSGIANLDADQPPPGWDDGIEKDIPPAEGYFDRALEYAILGTIQEWYLFEKKVFEKFPNLIPGTSIVRAEYILHCMGVSSGFKINSPASNNVLDYGNTYLIEWYAHAVRHDTRVKIRLLKDGAPIAEIGEAGVHDRQFSWIVDQEGIEQDDQSLRYQIQICTLDNKYTGNSGFFAIIRNQSGLSVSLQASNGQYVVAEGGGGGDVNANRDWAGPWETFELIDHNGGALLSGDIVSFRTCGNWYLNVELGWENNPIRARSWQIYAWEKFKIEKVGGSYGDVINSGDEVALIADDGQGQYVCAELGGGSVVNANRDARGPWETFIFVVH